MLSLLIVHENILVSLSNFTGLQLGKKFTHNCFSLNIKGLFTSWWTNNIKISSNVLLTIPPLHPSDNNTKYTCVISTQERSSICPQNQSKEYVLKLKSNLQ